MRSAFICVFFTILVRRGSADNDFRPMPIPLSEWHERSPRAGTLQETVRTAAPPAAAALPAHYWEDALRHSVYLTLVRDKIDQLIAKGDVISPETKPEHYISKEVDDHDLWEKIKTAPFERIPEEEPSTYGDVTIMAKGRLMEEKNGLRFAEDEMSKEKCTDEKCKEGVKAFWSVKRVRQREVETSPGKYHYELTFSVISQHPKKQKKPFENPVRTFTVRESSPEQVVEMPKEHRTAERTRVINPTVRPARAIWVHRNIVPTTYTQGRQYQHGLDRIFSSWFSDEDDDYVPPRPAYRPPPPQYMNPQFSKMGYVGSPTDQQKRLTPYPYKPHTYNKYSRPIPPPTFSHTQHHYVESDSVGHPYATPPDYRPYGPVTKPIKTTRPAVLPTPLPPITPPKNWTEPDTNSSNETEIITKGPEIITSHKVSRPIGGRPGPMKINFLSDHVRPPIYSAPPGVFVTMDKKPFKPMPPLKLKTKPVKHHYTKPIDFRPSPQVLDMQQFSDPDPLHDTAFRPMTWGTRPTEENTKTTESIEVAESTTKANNTRKTHPKGKKPPKKHENIKASRPTTTAPEIITASSDSEEESDAMQWANVVGAFSKTTPMASQKEKSEAIETTTPTTTSTSTTTTSTTTAAPRRRTSTTEAIEETSTTAKPKPKRTRPPPKFTKPSKPKKHKRVTTTKAPEVKSTQDLTPQASSAAATKPGWSPANRTQSTTTTTTSTTTTTTTTTPKPTTTTTKTTTTPSPSTAQTKTTPSITQTKIKNRFRQSTLIHKGTSIKHDRWSAPSFDKVKPTAPVAPEKNPPRRKGSNFHGYVSSTTPRNEEHIEKFHADHGMFKPLTVKPLSTTTPSYEETADQYESNSEPSDYVTNPEEEEEEQEEDEEESRDHTEYIFQPSTTPSERTNEVDHEPPTTEQITTTPKNKTKCKKKKLQNATTTEETNEALVPMEVVIPLEVTTQPPSTTTKTTSIFEELFGSFTVDDNETEKNSQTSKPDLQEEGSEKHGHFVKLDDDLQEFLDSLEKGKSFGDDHYDEDDDTEPEIDDVEEEESPRSKWSSDDKTYDDDHDDYEERKRDSHDSPFSLLELMAME